MLKRVGCLLFILCSSLIACCRHTHSSSWNLQYEHLDDLHTCALQEPSDLLCYDYLLMVAVDAKHLDYSSLEAFIDSVAHHPDGSIDRGIGHAWVAIRGMQDGEPFHVVCGHTGEFPGYQPRYLDQLYAVVQRGEPNPLKIFYETRFDGKLEYGSGGHFPSFAVAIPINKQQFQRLKEFIGKGGYDFQTYNILHHQCVHFAACCLAIVDLPIDVSKEYRLPQYAELFGKRVSLWNDPQLSVLEPSTPELLEIALLRLVHEGKAYPAIKTVSSLTATKGLCKNNENLTDSEAASVAL